MAKPTKSKAYVNFILDLLRSGNVERGKVLAIVGKKWQMPARTFDRYWKKANETYLEEQEVINKAKLDIYTKGQTEAAKTIIKSKTDRLLNLQNKVEYMEKQLRGEVQFTFFQGNQLKHSHHNGVFMLPIDTQLRIIDRIRQIEMDISELQGDKATQSGGVTNNQVNMQFNYSSLPNDVLNALEQAIITNAIPSTDRPK